MCLCYEDFEPQTVKVGNTIYVKAQHFITCEKFDYNLDKLKSEMQAGIDEQGWDVTITSLKKIRETEYDYLIGEAWYPADSPIAPIVIVAILALIQAIITAAVIIYVASVVYELFGAKPYYCPYCGASQPSVTALKAHISSVHPDKAQNICPYCGSIFSTEDELNAHIKECPFRPWTEKIPWNYVLVGVTIVIPTAYVIGKVLTKR